MRSRKNSFSFSLPRWMRASVVIVALSLAGKGLGFLRELETARLFGVGVSVDAFIAAYTLVFFVGRMASSSFLVSVPGLVIGYKDNSEQQGDWGNLFRALLLVGVGLTAIAALLLPRLVPVIFGGFGEIGQCLTIRLVRCMLPLVGGWTLIGALGGALNAQHRYGGYQVALLVANVGVLAVLWSFAGKIGIVALASGWTVGVWLGCVVLVLLLSTELRGLWQWVGWQAQWQAVQTLMGGANGLFVWFMLTQIPVWVDQYFVAQLEEGALSALGYAQRLFQLPLEMVTAVVVSVWVTRVAEIPSGQVVRQVFRLMGWLALVTFPVAGALVLLARPVVTLAYARGVFDGRAVAMTAGPFAMYALGFGFHALSAIATRTFQARGVSRYPIMVAAMDILLTGALDAWAISRGWGATGIAAVNTFVAAVNVGVLAVCWHVTDKKRLLASLSSEAE